MNLRTVRVIAMMLSGASCIALPGSALAHEGHHGRSQAHVENEGEHCSTCDYQDAMDKMHKDMMISYTGDTDLDFVAGMIPHHQGAVDMAKVELKYGKDPKLRYLANWIVNGQTAEIGWMSSWLNGRLNPNQPKKDTAQTAEFRKAMEKMHQRMTIDYTGDPDVDFARGMIPHHQGAIDMAVIDMRSGTNLEINKLAQGIFSSQKYEISVLQNWLNEHAPDVVAADAKKEAARTACKNKPAPNHTKSGKKQAGKKHGHDRSHH